MKMEHVKILALGMKRFGLKVKTINANLAKKLVQSVGTTTLILVFTVIVPISFNQVLNGFLMKTLT